VWAELALASQVVFYLPVAGVGSWETELRITNATGGRAESIVYDASSYRPLAAALISAGESSVIPNVVGSLGLEPGVYVLALSAACESPCDIYGFMVRVTTGAPGVRGNAIKSMVMLTAPTTITFADGGRKRAYFFGAGEAIAYDATGNEIAHMGHGASPAEGVSFHPLPEDAAYVILVPVKDGRNWPGFAWATQTWDDAAEILQ